MKKIAFFFTAIIVVSIAEAQITFSDSTVLLTIQNFISSFPVAIVDMNNDSLDDIVRIDMSGNIFIEYQVTGSSFMNSNIGTIGVLPWSICIADLENDGDNDVFVGGNSISPIAVIFRADSNGTIYNKEIFPESFFPQGANFVDIDNDGFVELFVCNDDSTNYVYHNDGLGNLTIDTNLILGTYSGNYGSVWTDYDNDNDLDLYISKCRSGVLAPADPRRINLLYNNDGTGNFSEVASAAGIADSAQSWVTDFADIDNDGDLDVFIVNHYDYSGLYENLGNGTYKDISDSSGIILTSTTLYYDYQAIFRDFDNNGFVDLLLGGGGMGLGGISALYLNNGDKTFALVPNAFPSMIDSIFSSFAVGDLNNDGFLDIYRTNEVFISGKDYLLMNNGNANNFVIVSLMGIISNINGIGARLELYGPWGKQIREVRSGEGYGVMHSFKQHFGIGTYNQIDSLIIKWPSGIVQKVTNIFPNQMFIVTETVGCNISIDTIMLVQQILCNGDSTGSVIVSVTDGIPPYIYIWSPIGGTNDTASGLTANFYIVTVTDAKGCITQGSISLSEPPPMAIITGTFPDTAGSGVGMAFVAVSGGIPSYSYLWNDPALQTTDTAYNLSAGTYTITVTDNNGCTIQDSVMVSNVTGNDQSSIIINQLTIYPTPAKDKLIIEFSSVYKQAIEVSIYNIIGNLIFKIPQQKISNELFKVDFSDQPAGIYYVKINTTQRILTRKVVIIR